VNIPANQKAMARFPRNPVVPATKTATQGDLGYFVDGVSMFDASDATSYSNASSRDGDPPGTPGGLTGDGIWNRDAYINEAITFDPTLAHQQNTGVYHYHANPIGPRYLLGDHVDFNVATKLSARTRMRQRNIRPSSAGSRTAIRSTDRMDIRHSRMQPAACAGW